ncbi:hypothetical protein WJX73_005720 [Symbiochloris irregularis]|uniref:Exonuclease domain-containing protein n=1 Tax=Symbiochloris irregularis TaxID=706552 RepID=A0AAW1PMA3_9CHLO
MQYFAMDVECVATSQSHNARAPAQVSLVDQNERVVLNLFIRPAEPVVSYLTPLTGLTRELIDSQGIPLQQALHILRQNLPPSAHLVGQSIDRDVKWLDLKEGQDFAGMLDLAGLFRVMHPKYKTWSVFSQDHLCKVLLGWDTSHMSHDALLDATKSMRLFNQYNMLQTNPQAWADAQAALLATPTAPSFAKLNPSFEGVCMGNKKTCVCGSPFIFS